MLPASVRPMWMSTEDARTDLILAAAVAVFGVFAVNLIAQLPLYPGDTLLGPFLAVGWVFVLTGLVPHLLTRHRQLGPESYGLGAHTHGWQSGLLLASPVVLAGLTRGLTQMSANPLQSLIGRFSRVAQSNPTISDGGGVAALDIVLQVLTWLALGVGMLLLFTFVTVRGRDAFARREMSVTEALRTFGMGSVIAALVFGLLIAVVSDRITVVSVMINVIALAAMILIADRLVPHGIETPRAAILAPLVLGALLHLLGARGGNLLFGLYAGSLAAGIGVVIGSVIEGRAHARAVLPLVAAMALYPSCLSPLAVDLFPIC